MFYLFTVRYTDVPVTKSQWFSYGVTVFPMEQTERVTRMVLSQMDAGKALTAAAAKGNTREVQRILEECRVLPDTRNEFGQTALQVRTIVQ